jgi:hypothetical protein
MKETMQNFIVKTLFRKKRYAEAMMGLIIMPPIILNIQKRVGVRITLI